MRGPFCFLFSPDLSVFQDLTPSEDRDLLIEADVKLYGDYVYSFGAYRGFYPDIEFLGVYVEEPDHTMVKEAVELIEKMVPHVSEIWGWWRATVTFVRRRNRWIWKYLGRGE